MKDTFNDKELRLIRKLQNAPVQTILQYREACPIHSTCMPLPVFRLYRSDEETFAAEWNFHHRRGPKQSFRFAEVLK